MVYSDGTEDTRRSSNRRPKILSSLSNLLIESQHKMRAACSATDLVALACRQIGCNKKVSSEITDCSLQQLPLNSFPQSLPLPPKPPPPPFLLPLKLDTPVLLLLCEDTEVEPSSAWLLAQAPAGPEAAAGTESEE